MDLTAAQRARIVDYDPRCLDELVALWRASFEAALGIVDPHPLDEQRRYFVEQVEPANRVRMAVVDGRLAGFIAASRESIAQLHVHIAWQRRGIGSQLLAWAKGQSGGSLWLYTFAKNAVARRFYEKHGFVAIEFGFEPTWQLDDVRYRWTADASDVDLQGVRMHGACHCGNIAFDLEWGGSADNIPARACGCSFCTKHGGVWTSHPASRLVVTIRDRTRVSRYAFGSKTATFHVCSDCGVAPLVTSDIGGRTFAVVNVNALDDVDPSRLRKAAVSFDGEDVETRLARRSRNWIADVRFRGDVP